MNKHILVAMDWKNRSKEELMENAESAYNADVYTAAVADAAYTAADAADAAAYAAADAAAYAVASAAADAAYAEFWINEYFENTGEDRKDYEKALKEMKR